MGVCMNYQGPVGMNLLIGEDEIEAHSFQTEGEAKQKAKEDLKKLLSSKYALKNLPAVEGTKRHP